MKRQLSFVAALALLSGCSGSKIAFSIDNPTNGSLNVTVDGTRYVVPAQGEKAVALKPGPHTLESSATGRVDFIVYAKGRGGLINPTCSPYVTVNAIYSINEESVSRFRPIESDVELDGVPLRGPFRVSNDMFIEKTWEFGVHQDFAESIRVSRESKGNIQGKIFSRTAFISFIEEQQKSPGYFAQHGKQAALELRFYVPAELPVFVDAELEAKSAPFKDIYRRYQGARDAGEQLKLQQEYHQATMDLLNVFAPKASTLGKEENEKWNRLMGLSAELFGRSALVVK